MTTATATFEALDVRLEALAQLLNELGEDEFFSEQQRAALSELGSALDEALESRGTALGSQPTAGGQALFDAGHAWLEEFRQGNATTGLAELARRFDNMAVLAHLLPRKEA